MKTKTVITLVILFSTTCFGITEYKSGDSLYVWAESGLNLRESPDSKSEIVTKISFGEKVLCQGFKSWHDYQNSSQKITDRIKIENKEPVEIVLRGSWVKVEFGRYVGYVFDSYLSRFEPVPMDYKNSGLFDFFKNECDSIIYLEKKDSNLENGRDKIVFCNGIFMTRNYHPGAYWFQMNIPDFSVEEAFLILRYLDKHIVGINQGREGAVNIHQDLGGYEIEFYKNMVIISGEWSC